MRIATDGYIDLTDARHVRTPGEHGDQAEPVPEEEALAFLLSHTFPGHRRVIRPLSIEERRRIQRALWADSVSERMALVDRVWRAITEEVGPPADMATPELIQVIRCRQRTYPLYLDGRHTRVIPDRPLPEAGLTRQMVMDFDLKTA
ncbi:MAG: hypothetical protein U5R14_13200 [Gemmatimonadota bacterium]|nr:hypothetical protein [Gemmatimonadota bacterium]